MFELYLWGVGIATMCLWGDFQYRKGFIGLYLRSNLQKIGKDFDSHFRVVNSGKGAAPRLSLNELFGILFSWLYVGSFVGIVLRNFHLAIGMPNHIKKAMWDLKYFDLSADETKEVVSILVGQAFLGDVSTPLQEDEAA